MDFDSKKPAEEEIVEEIEEETVEEEIVDEEIVEEEIVEEEVVEKEPVGERTRMKPYDPPKFWDMYAGKYLVENDQHVLETERMMVLINEHVFSKMSRVPTILDSGSGDGRLYPYLTSHVVDSEIHLCDIAAKPRTICHKNTGIWPEHWDGKELPYDSRQFDLVILFDVLLHVPPADLGDFFEEHIRVCKKYLFVATGYWKEWDRSSHWCFPHDYRKLFARTGVKIVDQAFWHGTKGTHRYRANWLLRRP
jgi:SAM-dependent methyltransferase